MTNSEIDRLGEQLKLLNQSKAGFDIPALDVYRLSFEPATLHVEQSLRAHNLPEFTQRTKSTPSIIAKLRRESHMRLHQIQDVSGFRYIVDSINEQDDLVQKLSEIFEAYTIKDKRIEPSFGYRAVHLIVKLLGKKVEIQVRTLFQHQWAELSEMIADSEGHELKYGGGDQRISTFLDNASDTIYQRELALARSDIQISKAQIKSEFEALFTRLNFPNS